MRKLKYTCIWCDIDDRNANCVFITKGTHILDLNPYLR